MSYGYQSQRQQLNPQIYQYFQIADQNRSGQIDFQELSVALKNDANSTFSPESCRMMVAMFDADGNNQIGPHEFEKLWVFLGQWRQAFNSFDTDRSGQIDSQELASALQNMGYRFSQNFIQKCMQKFDINRTGNLSFDEFVRLCCVLQSLTQQFSMNDTNRSGMIMVGYEQFLNMVFSSSM